MFAAALGCNLAWGLVDAVMYLVRTLTDRGKRLTTALAVKNAPDPAAGRLALAESLAAADRGLVGDAELEAIRARVAAAELPARPRLHGRDYGGAIGIFCIVVATTFPVALPFLIFEVKTGLLVSRVLTLVMLFGGGVALGHYAGFGGWKAGLGMTALGVVLTMAIIALGG
jgi:VIT1/CCC1 family predicted Fe2+/Mn2+ transporter